MKLQQKQHKLTHNKLCGILFHLQLSHSLFDACHRHGAFFGAAAVALGALNENL